VVAHNRWGGCVFKLPDSSASERRISVQGEVFAVERILLVTEREGRFVVVTRVNFTRDDCPLEPLDLPLGTRLASQGIESVELDIPEGKPMVEPSFHRSVTARECGGTNVAGAQYGHGK
jgi:hypothetical protein